MSECWIGLGANLGNAHVAFDAAWSQLRDHPQIEVRKRSGLYRTAPVGTRAGEAFLNAVGCLWTTLAPLELLDVLQSIELDLGRTREVQWGPRTLDLDLLFVNDRVIREPRLTVPHPAAWYRRFVIDPLFEVAPRLSHPGLDLSVAALRERLQVRPLSIAFGETWISLVDQIGPEVASRFPNTRLIILDDSRACPVLNMRVHLDNTEPFESVWHDAIVADLRAAPGEPTQRVIDFLTAVFDEPERVGDW